MWGTFESAGEGTNIQRAIHILLILHGDKRNANAKSKAILNLTFSGDVFHF
jgi:hypothetical protein